MTEYKYKPSTKMLSWLNYVFAKKKKRKRWRRYYKNKARHRPKKKSKIKKTLKKNKIKKSKQTPPKIPAWRRRQKKKTKYQRLLLRLLLRRRLGSKIKYRIYMRRRLRKKYYFKYNTFKRTAFKYKINKRRRFWRFKKRKILLYNWRFNYRVFRKIRTWRDISGGEYVQSTLAAPWLHYLLFSKALYIKQRNRSWNRLFPANKAKSKKSYLDFQYLRRWATRRDKFFKLKKIYWKFFFYFFGKYSRNFCARLFANQKHVKSSKTPRNDLFMKPFESRIDVLTYRANWGKTIQWARVLASHGLLNLVVTKNRNYKKKCPIKPMRY